MASAHLGLGIALFELFRHAEALPAFHRAAELNPGNPEILTGRGRAHYENQDNEAAIADFTESLRIRPGHAETLCFRGAAYHDMDEDEIGIEDITEALKIDPQYAPCYFFRGRIFAKYQDEDGAFAEYSRAIDLDPGYPYPYSYRSNIWSSWEEPEKSTQDQETYLKLRPTADAYHSQAHNWERREEAEKAAECFATAIRLEPNQTRHYSCRANLWYGLGEDDKGDADIEEIERLNTIEEQEDEMNATIEQRMKVYNQIQNHFSATPLEDIEVTTRLFPSRVGADLQLALDRLEGGGISVEQFWPLHQCGQAPSNFTQLYTRDRRNPPLAVPPEYIEIDVGEAEPVRTLKFGVWLASCDGAKLLVILDTQNHRGIHFQAANIKGVAGQTAVSKFFNYLEEGIKKGGCYRGKVLSLESNEDSYSGQQYGIRVHKLRPVLRDEVILPPATLVLLERNVIQFVRQRERLAALGMQTKKGLLFYGPPGTGKTHTIHFLARGIEGQTTFLVSAEQVGLLTEYMTLARLFQPSMVVIEDVDLIARDRTTMHTPGEEVLLNKLLNEMDGLKPETDILFVLTTNRPEKLEAALASRPGRIDQAIEFPLPDEVGREKLVRLYSRRVDVADELVSLIVKKTDRVSASFIKELMRRATQYYLDRNGSGALNLEDVSNALEEMLFHGGSLNRVLLGAAEPSSEE